MKKNDANINRIASDELLQIQWWIEESKQEGNFLEEVKEKIETQKESLFHFKKISQEDWRDLFEMGFEKKDEEDFKLWLGPLNVLKDYLISRSSKNRYHPWTSNGLEILIWSRNQEERNEIWELLGKNWNLSESVRGLSFNQEHDQQLKSFIEKLILHPQVGRKRDLILSLLNEWMSINDSNWSLNSSFFRDLPWEKSLLFKDVEERCLWALSQPKIGESWIEIGFEELLKHFERIQVKKVSGLLMNRLIDDHSGWYKEAYWLRTLKILHSLENYEKIHLNRPKKMEVIRWLTHSMIEYRIIQCWESYQKIEDPEVQEALKNAMKRYELYRRKWVKPAICHEDSWNYKSGFICNDHLALKSKSLWVIQQNEWKIRNQDEEKGGVLGWFQYALLSAKTQQDRTWIKEHFKPVEFFFERTLNFKIFKKVQMKELASFFEIVFKDEIQKIKECRKNVMVEHNIQQLNQIVMLSTLFKLTKQNQAWMNEEERCVMVSEIGSKTLREHKAIANRVQGLTAIQWGNAFKDPNKWNELKESIQMVIRDWRDPEFLEWINRNINHEAWTVREKTNAVYYSSFYQIGTSMGMKPEEIFSTDNLKLFAQNEEDSPWLEYQMLEDYSALRVNTRSNGNGKDIIQFGNWMSKNRDFWKSWEDSKDFERGLKLKDEQGESTTNEEERNNKKIRALKRL